MDRFSRWLIKYVVEVWAIQPLKERASEHEAAEADLAVTRS
jgi:hypothetical protein